ncbi:acetolactate synthase small subunit [Serpentinicella alkaliphila]|uniref:Acetolactate synthase small subunit n=1 Tax=Serpentinicella alkaliphila TaxID=1734049 RepID=A0A4R2TFK3_9FIRM|nr:acetolactate synthase small subunit [Serpentinicella alkaliphila]QUH25825.1 acetolactate synthase small subunit [Serpentinicella alkaliphila]TCP99844.1 acetolactate synthase small subunit [Serpentinicella alkaliphila]
MTKTEHVIMELTVNNHPGVMYNITGLFARRAFNLEGILCGRAENTNTSKMYLLIKNDNRIDQTIKQLEKLYDVLSVSICSDCDVRVFDNISKLIKLK